MLFSVFKTKKPKILNELKISIKQASKTMNLIRNQNQSFWENKNLSCKVFFKKREERDEVISENENSEAINN